MNLLVVLVLIVFKRWLTILQVRALVRIGFGEIEISLLQILISYHDPTRFHLYSLFSNFSHIHYHLSVCRSFVDV